MICSLTGPPGIQGLQPPLSLLPSFLPSLLCTRPTQLLLPLSCPTDIHQASTLCQARAHRSEQDRHRPALLGLAICPPSVWNIHPFSQQPNPSPALTPLQKTFSNLKLTLNERMNEYMTEYTTSVKSSLTLNEVSSAVTAVPPVQGCGTLEMGIIWIEMCWECTMHAGL